MDPTKTTKPQIHVIGVEVRTRNDLEANPVTAKIPGLWRRFFQENLAAEIENRKDANVLFGAYTNYQSDHTGYYSLLIGAEVSKLEMIPQGMAGITIPATEYLVFPAPGKIPEAIMTAWGNIWKYFPQDAPCQRAYTTDFELYRTNHDGQTQGEIYIAVR